MPEEVLEHKAKAGPRAQEAPHGDMEQVGPVGQRTSVRHRSGHDQAKPVLPGWPGGDTVHLTLMGKLVHKAQSATMAEPNMGLVL